MATRPVFKGEGAFFRSIKEQGRDYEFDCEKAERLDQGEDRNTLRQTMMADPKWQPLVDMEQEDAILELDRISKSEKGCALDRSVAWVADNIGNDRARKKDAPGKGTAWVLYEWARTSETNKSEFIKNLLSRLMPSNKDLDNQARYSDDGSTQIELAERILARMAENVAT